MASLRQSKTVACRSNGVVIMSLKRSIQFVVLLIALLLPVVVQAQAPTPAQSPVRSLSDNISALSQRAAGLLPYFDKEIVSKLMGGFEVLAWVLGNCLAGFAMLRDRK